jgi:endonuclease/exonuclease/phosphatase family metal-dependent hydrolase
VKTLRIGQLNLNNKAQEERLPSIAAAVAKAKIDVLAVQELINPQSLKDAFLPHGYVYSYFTEYLTHSGATEYVGFMSSERLNLSNATLTAAEEGFGLVTVKTHKTSLHIIAAHFAWGSHSEPRRLAQAEVVDSLALAALAEEPGVALLAGDLNAEPDYRSIRYLSGKDLSADGKRSTLWTDAWVTAGTPANEFTSKHSTNSQGRVTAFKVGISYPGFLPDRRIDYILTRGWNYGREGSPVSFGLIADGDEPDLSDHEGIYADILLEIS